MAVLPIKMPLLAESLYQSSVLRCFSSPLRSFPNWCLEVIQKEYKAYREGDERSAAEECFAVVKRVQPSAAHGCGHRGECRGKFGN
jgi:hypothetical protein